ncbi:hypothetical protein Pcinc_039216 [Petrolisthes cinctipes]|uniref:Uncharacterized protein n=1 Tax=Petrolisthes cinctipes TaxID=88211 RepID=A0AAE1EJH1_PETCI|nr:hypothetical protein Pcinc_039216 [Petrolisthes cinctipes]
MEASSEDRNQTESKKVLRGASLTVGEKESLGTQDKYSFHGETTQRHQNGSQPEESKKEEIHGHIKVLRPTHHHRKSSYHKRPNKKKMTTTCNQPPPKSSYHKRPNKRKMTTTCNQPPRTKLSLCKPRA